MPTIMKRVPESELKEQSDYAESLIEALKECITDPMGEEFAPDGHRKAKQRLRQINFKVMEILDS